MKTFYNEFDHFAATWLRNLQLGGHITDGVVNESSIKDLKAKDLTQYGRAHFFAGIGGWDLALKIAGWEESRGIWTGSCPCQPFSNAGKRKGVADERHLWPVWARLIKACRPPVIFGEQVASAAGRDWLSGVRADLEGMGYELGGADLCAAGFGAPHIRQRLYWMAYAKGQRRHRVEDPTGPHGRPGSENRGRLGNAGSARLALSKQQAVLSARGRGQRGATQQPSGAPAGRVDNALRHGRAAQRHHDAGNVGLITDTKSSARGMEHPTSFGREQRRAFAGWGGAFRRRGAKPWGDYYVIPCQDGKARRVGSGVFPLAHGVPHRVGKLRGAGNAIVPFQAAVFVRVCMEFLGVAP